MKQERIEELLKGTKYTDRLVGNPYCPKVNALYDDAPLNAARVQLLAKVLLSVRDKLPSGAFDAEVADIDAALQETGLGG